MLMAFNEKDSYTFQELKEVSGKVDKVVHQSDLINFLFTGTIEVPKSFLVKTMMKLFESKILICSGDSRNIEPDTTISLNTNFERSVEKLFGNFLLTRINSTAKKLVSASKLP